MTEYRRYAGVIAIALALSVTAPLATAAATTELNLDGSGQVDEGSTTTFDVVVQNADTGVTGVDFTVQLTNDTGDARITDFDPSGSPAAQSVDVSASEVDASYGYRGSSTDADGGTLGTVTVEGVSSGDVDLEIPDDVIISNDSNREYTFINLPETTTLSVGSGGGGGIDGPTATATRTVTATATTTATRTATATATTTATRTATASGDDTDGSEPPSNAAGGSGSDAETEVVDTVSSDGPGFGSVAAVLSLVTALLLSRIRSRSRRR